MGLIADSLDMLADASVYGLSLFVVGTTAARKKDIAKISGYLQMGLASLGFVEVLRRFLGAGDMPEFQWMIIIASLALAANLVTQSKKPGSSYPGQFHFYLKRHYCKWRSYYSREAGLFVRLPVA